MHFTFKWLHQDLEGETFTVPSSSIMKLATNCINVHPVVAVFLKSVKQIHSSCASLFPTVLEETDGELDINKLLEKQIEDISNSANASKEGMSEDILLGVKGGHATQLLYQFDQFKHVVTVFHLIQFSVFFFLSYFLVGGRGGVGRC